jgi:hypothetical protein
VRAALALIDATLWLADKAPGILSYLGEPKSLEELERDAGGRRLGYQDHHVVETQYRSNDPLANSHRFIDRLENSENVVSIPSWKHVEISSWYSTPNREEYGGQTPREFLKGKSWEEQYQLGIQKLRDFGVLR